MPAFADAGAAAPSPSPPLPLHSSHQAPIDPSEYVSALQLDLSFRFHRLRGLVHTVALLKQQRDDLYRRCVAVETLLKDDQHTLPFKAALLTQTNEVQHLFAAPAAAHDNEPRP
jgi:hypothetical protein